MRLKSAIAALLSTAAVATASAAQTLDFTGYSVLYDETTVLGQATAFQGNRISGFSWTIPNTIHIDVQGAALVKEFVLPSFTVAAKPGFTLSNPSLSLGNLPFNEADGRNLARAGVEFFFESGVDGLPEWQQWNYLDPDRFEPVGNGLASVRSGYFAGSLPVYSGDFRHLDVWGSLLVLRAHANGAISASVGSDGQAQLRVTLSMTPVLQPVPEPQTLALFVAGLAGLGIAAWRRQRG